MKNLHRRFDYKIKKKFSSLIIRRLTISFLFVLSLNVQARELIEVGQSSIGKPQIQKTLINTGLPPIKIGELSWINAFGYQNWQLPETTLTQHRWSLGFTQKLNETQSAAVFIPTQINSDENSLSIRGNSSFTTVIATINQQENEFFSWSYGFIVTDQSNGRRLYPAAGLRMKSHDELWKFNLGFPAISLTYLGFEKAELSFILGRDNTMFYLNQIDKNISDIRYKEVTLNSLATQYKKKFESGLSVSVRYGYLFSSGVYNLGSDFRRIDTVQNLNNQSQITLMLGIGFPEDTK